MEGEERGTDKKKGSVWMPTYFVMYSEVSSLLQTEHVKQKRCQ